jgi:hypothetical protein
VSAPQLDRNNILYPAANMPTFQQIGRLYKRHNEAATESEQPSAKRLDAQWFAAQNFLRALDY